MRERKGRSARIRRALLGDFVPEDAHEYRINRHDFIIYVGGDPSYAGDADEPTETGVEHRMADRFEINLGILSSVCPNKPILVVMASCGGYWDEGMQMFSAILTCPNPVTVLATKWARSMTSLIPLAADRFLIRPSANYMFHRGTFGFSGLDQEAETQDVERRKSREVMYRLYVARLREQGKFARWSEKRIREMLEDKTIREIDVWLSADEATEWGFADAVFDGDWKTLRAKQVNKARRERMLSVLRRPVEVNVTIG